MLTFFFRRWPLGLLACIQVFAAHATSHEQATQSSFQYRSALEGYRSFADESIPPWVETNEVVRKIGGWRAYAAERSTATEPLPDSGKRSPPASSRPEGSPKPHAGHGSKP
jgi:hypothetical protein